MGALLRLSQVSVEAPRGPKDLSVALSEPMVAHPACYSFRRGFVILNGVLDGLLESQLPPSLARLLEGCIPWGGVRLGFSTFLEGGVGNIVVIARSSSAIPG
jgi:hypothetical protein